MVGLYARSGRSEQAIALFQEMVNRDIHPGVATFVAALGACRAAEFLERGRELHCFLLRLGYENDVLVSTALVTMYSRCGSLSESEQVFRGMQEKNLVSWNALISAYAERGLGNEAASVLRRMQLEGVRAAASTYLSIMRAFQHPSQLSLGASVHNLIREAGLEQEVTVGTAVVNMYSKCGSLENAKRAFQAIQEPNVISWNVLIDAHIQHGLYREARLLFRRLLQLGLNLDLACFVNIFGACCGSSLLDEARLLHSCALEAGMEAGSAAILHMYTKCGSLHDAEAVFNAMAERSQSCWNAMIISYVQHQQPRRALQAYRDMQAARVVADEYTYVAALDACATSGNLRQGKDIHRQLGEDKICSSLGNALVNMYAKCGKLQEARRIFDKAPKEAISWNTMLAAYSQHGHGDEVFKLFPAMLLEGFEPSRITFISILSACAHKGLLLKGRDYFLALQADHSLSLEREHYGCMMDLLGKAGRLEDVRRLMDDMPYEPDIASWTSFFEACRSHGDARRGKAAAEGAVSLDPSLATSYVVVSTTLQTVG